VNAKPLLGIREELVGFEIRTAAVMKIFSLLGYKTV
jgi:hypothetical protein